MPRGKVKALKPSKSKLVQLAAKSVVMDPVLDDNGKVVDINLLIAPMYRGGKNVGRYAINNPVLSSDNPSQYQQHYIPIKWSTFNQLFDSRHSVFGKRTDNITKKHTIDILNHSFKPDKLKLKFKPNGELDDNINENLFFLQNDPTGIMNFDAQLDTYSDLAKQNNTKYNAIVWSSAQPPVSTQFPSVSQFRDENMQRILISNAQFVPSNVDKNGKPQEIRVRIRPTFRDSSSEHQAKKPLLDDQGDHSKFMIEGLDGDTFRKHGQFQEISLKEFNRILQTCNQQTFDKSVVQNFNFEQKKPDPHNPNPHVEYKPMDVKLPKPLYFDALAPEFSYTSKKDGTAKTFRYIETSRVLGAGMSNLLLKMAEDKRDKFDLSNNDEKFSPDLAIKDTSIMPSQLRNLLRAGTNQPKISQKSQTTKTSTETTPKHTVKKSEKLSDHQTFTISLDQVIAATQVRDNMQWNLAPLPPERGKETVTKDKSDTAKTKANQDADELAK